MKKMSSEQITRLREATPGCERVLHFNNAGASLMPDPVYRAVTEHLALERDIGGYEAANESGPALGRLYSALAQLLRVEPDEIAFVENATRAWDMAFYSLPLVAGDRIITHASEYASSFLAFLHLAKRRGIEIDIAPSDESGQIDVAALGSVITPRTKVINITHVPTQGGLINPAAEVGRFARERDLIYILDACQSVGQMDVDVSEIGCHILSGTGRKFLRGPRGTGFLYVSNEICQTLDPPFIDMRAATWTAESSYELAPGARRFENWESYVAGRVGLATAVDYALEIGLPAIEQRISDLSSHLRENLTDINGVSLLDQGVRKCGIVTFVKSDEIPNVLAERLRSNDVNISTSTPDSARLDLGGRGIAELARASVHYFNTHDEIDRFCDLVARR